MVINKEHLNYINNTILLNFIRENNIKIPNCKYSTENMVQIIDDYARLNSDNMGKVRMSINSWLLQGRKKIIYRYFEENIDYNEDTTKEIKMIKSKFNFTSRRDLADLEVPKSTRELWNIDFTYDEKIKKIDFLFVEKLNKKIKDTETYKEIVIPIMVEFNVEEKEIHARIPAKSDLYRQEDSKIEDIKVAQEVLEYVIETLGFSKNISAIQKSELRSILFAIHDEITELPEEIMQTADSINDEIDEFIVKVTEKIEMLDDEVNEEEMFQGIKNVILKHVIGMCDDKGIFEQGKYAISTGIDGSGISMSNFKFSAPASEPIQSNPEYQDIRSIIGPLEQIRKDVLLWNSVRNNSDKIRMKMYAHSSGYIQICFEQYVFEEDIENVLSKIREFKERR